MADPFDFPDPFRSFDPFRNLGGGMGGGRKPAAFPVLPEEETQSGIGALTSGALSTLGYVGSELDKLFGGRALRGALGGKPRELLSLLPGSDVIGLTNEADTVRGEDLLRNIGYDPSQGSWLERNLAGPAVEMALDPSVWFGGIGALTKLGQAAAKSGGVVKGLLHGAQAGQKSLHPLVAAADWLRPGTQLAVADALAAAKYGSAPYVSKALDLAEKIPVAGVGVRGARRILPEVAEKVGTQYRSLFDAAAGYVPWKSAQTVHEHTMLPEYQQLMGPAREQYANFRNRIQPLLDRGVPQEHIDQYLRSVKERTPHWPGKDVIRNRLDPNDRAVLDLIATESRGVHPGQLAAEQARGGKTESWQSIYGIPYDPRRNAAGAFEGALAREKFIDPSNPSQLKRMPGLDVPGGVNQANQLTLDPRFTGAGRSLTEAEAIEALVDEVYLPPFGGAAVRHEMGPDMLKGFEDRAEELANVLHHHVLGQPIYETDILKTDLARKMSNAKTLSNQSGLFQMIGLAAQPEVNPRLPNAPTVTRLGERGAMDVPSLLREAKLTYAPQGTLQMMPAMEAAADALRIDRQQIQDMVDASLLTAHPLTYEEALRNTLKNYKLPAKDAAAAVAQFQRWATPEEMKNPRWWGDSSLNLIKTWLYSVWPAAHGRNLFSGRFGQNLLEVGMPPWAKEYGEYSRMSHGGGIQTGLPEYAGLTPAEEALRFQEHLYGNRIRGAGQGEVVSKVGVPTMQPALNPSLPRPTMMQVLGQIPRDLATPEGRSLTEVSGVGGRQATRSALPKAGEAIGGLVEENLRTPEYLYLRRKGYTPEAARAQVETTHIFYENLTDFEKQVMKRLIPFYTFSSRNIPKQVQLALEHPGRMGSLMRLTGAMQDQGIEGGYTPEYLRSGLAIPLLGSPEGTQRFLTQTGLPFEEAFARLKVGRTPTESLMNTGMGFLSMLRPELKAALETVTGKQFFTGRDLADLHVGPVESLGGLLDDESAGLVAQLLGGSPGARAWTTANRFLDTRKYTPSGVMGLGAGFLTGAKVTDVETEKWRALDARRHLESILARAPGIRESTNYYATPEAKATGMIDPVTAYYMSLYNSLKQQAHEAAALRNKQMQVGVQQ